MSSNDDEYPPERWPLLYGGVLGLLAVNIVIFMLITRWFS